jgi:hypothetical protein
MESVNMKFIDLTGKRFGRLLVVSRAENKDGKTAFNCSCDCGTAVVAKSLKLIGGLKRSCGFLRDKGRGKFRATYNTWHSMVRRCTDPSTPRYERYGGRGITVCNEWLNNFEKFAADMGIRPSGCTLDRKDNDGNYEPGNCRWVNNSAQARNKSSTREITFRGETRCMADWASHLGMSRTTLQNRIYRGWPIERALTELTNKSGDRP